MNELDFGPCRASEFRHRAFWTVFSARHPVEAARRARHGPWFWQRALPDLNLVITMYVAPERSLVGVFFGRNEKLARIIGHINANNKPILTICQRLGFQLAESTDRMTRVTTLVL